MQNNRLDNNKAEQSNNQSSVASFMYIFLLCFAFITILAACSSGDDQKKTRTVGSETWEMTCGIADMPQFLTKHTDLTNELYAQVAEHSQTMEQLQCYCGCIHGTAIDEPHNNLLRCYWAEAPAEDGSITWTDHSTTCGICKHELEMVIDLTKQGQSAAEIKQAIDKAYN